MEEGAVGVITETGGVAVTCEATEISSATELLADCCTVCILGGACCCRGDSDF